MGRPDIRQTIPWIHGIDILASAISLKFHMSRNLNGAKAVQIKITFVEMLLPLRRIFCIGKLPCTI